MMAKWGGVQVCQWSTGWTLWRMVDDEWAQDIGLQRPSTRPIFILRDPHDHLVYELVYNNIEQRFSNDYLHVLLSDPDAPFPEATARQICLSAIVEVLGLPISNRFLYKGPLLIPLFREETSHALQQERAELPPLVERLTAMHDAEMALHKPQRERLGDARKLYANTALNTFRWTLNLNRFRSPRMLEYASYPSVSKTVKSVLKGVGIVQGTSYQIVLELGFLPQPSWSVRIEQEYRTQEDWLPPEELVTGAVGPTHALVQAGILGPLTVEEGRTIDRIHASAEQWLDQRLETAPDLTERFDVEPYRLLSTDIPYLWPLDAFLTWVKEQPDAR